VNFRIFAWPAGVADTKFTPTPIPGGSAHSVLDTPFKPPAARSRTIEALFESMARDAADIPHLPDEAFTRASVYDDRG
jgi:hypothetical protein